MSVHVDDLFMTGGLDTLENIKDMIKLDFNIQEYGRVRNFLGVYYDLYHDYKGVYTKISMGKYVNKLVIVYDKFTGSYNKVHKTLASPGTTISEIELEEPMNIEKYRSLVGQIMWYTTKVGTEVSNATS